MDLIVTDLTRFAKDDIVCIAGIELEIKTMYQAVAVPCEDRM